MNHFAQSYYHARCAIRHAGKAALALCMSPAILSAIWAAALMGFLLVSTGCSLLSRRADAVIKGGDMLQGSKATAPKDNGTPAVVTSDGAETKTPVPAGSTMRETRTEETPATPTTPYKPAFTVKELTFAADSFIVEKSQRATATTGTIDTSVAMHRIESEERRPLLFCAIAAVVAGLGFMYVRFQSIAVMCFIAAGAFFLAWKMAEISPWVGGLFLTAAVAGFAFYKRAEWDNDGDGVPDFLQHKNDKSTP